MTSPAQTARARRQEAETLALPLEIEAGHWPRLFRGIIASLVLLVVALLALAAVTPLRQLSIADGQVVPEQAVLPLHHLEGGIVGKVHVRVGQVVYPGQTLLTMAATQAQGDLEQLEARRLNLEGARVRLDALLGGSEPDFTSVAERNPAIAHEQNAQHAQERAALEKSRQVHASRIAQRQAELAAAEADLATVEGQVAAQRERLELREKLFLDGLSSRTAFLDAKVMLDQALSRLAQVRGQIAAGQSALQEAADARADSEAARQVAWQSERTRVAAELNETAQMLPRLRDRLERLEVRAPARALVQAIVPRGPGEVVRPGEMLAELVPIGETLLADVRLKPEDAGHVRAGGAARVKLTAFDAETFGAIDATVTTVSPTTIHSEKGEPFYKATLALTRTRLVRGATAHDILPGMVVRAEIITGEKSVLRYLLKPIYRSLDVTFAEK